MIICLIYGFFMDIHSVSEFVVGLPQNTPRVWRLFASHHREEAAKNEEKGEGMNESS
jgi:hypothetical protein